MSGAWLSREEVLATLGVHRQTLWRLQRDKNFPRPIARGFFEQREVRNWMRRHRWRKNRQRPARPARADQVPQRPPSVQRRNPVDWVSYGVMARVKGG
jgi:predicted DNA-binding transcriptional regulator AlpA